MTDSGVAASAAPRARWYVLAVMTLVYALNIADRFSITTLIEPIRKELALSDKGIAFLTGTALVFFYVTAGIPIAALADRLNRRNILAVGVTRSYGQLLLARIAVGVGEAGGTPPSTAIVADNFPPQRRPLALTIYALGACLGAWLGTSVAGAAADAGGWRLAFLVPAGMRATACAILLFLAPQLLVGPLSDWFAASFNAGPESLRWALLLLAPTGLWAAWHLWRAGATIREDEARVRLS